MNEVQNEKIIPVLLNGRDAAAYLKISKSTLYGMADAGKIPFVWVGSYKRFRPEDLDGLLQNNVYRINGRDVLAFPEPGVVGSEMLTQVLID